MGRRRKTRRRRRRRRRWRRRRRKGDVKGSPFSIALNPTKVRDYSMVLKIDGTGVFGGIAGVVYLA